MSWEGRVGRCRNSICAAVLLVALGTALCLGSNPASAATDQDAYGRFVEKLGRKLTDILETPNVNLSARKERFRVLFRKYFDSVRIGRIVLGRTWRELTEDQRDDYKHLFYNYVSAVYAVIFSRYEGATLKILDVRSADAANSTVNAEVDEPGKTPINIQFKVHDGGDNGMKIEDVEVENLSLIVSFRNEINNVVQLEGFDGVLKRMKMLQMPLSAPIAK
jgi:phospholipid transport system substrate-binding protein